MKTEKQFTLERDQYGLSNRIEDADSKVIFTRHELCFLGVPQEALEACEKGPVTIKVSIEAL